MLILEVRRAAIDFGVRITFEHLDMVGRGETAVKGAYSACAVIEYPEMKPNGEHQRGYLLKLITQLAILLQQRTAQHRLRRQALAARRPNRAAVQIIHHQPDQLVMLIKPLRHRS